MNLHKPLLHSFFRSLFQYQFSFLYEFGPAAIHCRLRAFTEHTQHEDLRFQALALSLNWLFRSLIDCAFFFFSFLLCCCRFSAFPQEVYFRILGSEREALWNLVQSIPCKLEVFLGQAGLFETSSNPPETPPLSCPRGAYVFF